MAEKFNEKEAFVLDSIGDVAEVPKLMGTSEDRYDMTRIGKKQELLV